MAHELLPYYERELSFLRHSGAEFAATYPKIASRLLLAADTCEDPHVERLLQGFAWLTARVHHKLEDELPEITDALLSVLYPHYLAPIPSMAIVQCVVDPDQGPLTGGYTIAPQTTLYSQPVQGRPCRFRTCYPVTLWPLEVTSARLEAPDPLSPASAVAMLRLGLRCLGGATFAALALDRLRLFLHGEGALACALYEALFTATCQIQLRPGGLQGVRPPIVLDPQCLRPVGFAPDEGLLPSTPRSFPGYRLLQEYFSFPAKFLFADLLGLDRAVQAGFGAEMDVCFCLRRAPRLAQPLTPQTFRLGCTPVVNLFPQVAEPIRLTHAQSEYRVVPDVRRQESTEVYSVDTVTCDGPAFQEPLALQPFYAVQHDTARPGPQAYWYAARRPSQRPGDEGTEVYLALANLDLHPTLPAADTLTVHVTCTNRDLPAKLPFGGAGGDFTLEHAAPLARIRCLTKPTPTVRPPLGHSARWRLISHLSLNHLSLCEGGLEALRAVLQLYDFTDSAVVRQQIAGITGIQSRRVVGRPASMPWNGVCRGLEVTVTFDEEHYVGSGVLVFATVLERFFALYASLNSFTRMIAVTQQREEPLHQWPPRAGEQILL